MEGLLLLLMFPIIWPFIAKKIWGKEITWTELGINVGGIALIITGLWFAGTHGQMADVEIWNGKIAAKDRVHGTYEDPYDCNCRQVCSGSGKNKSCSNTCDTCYETRYTVEWTARALYGGSLDYITFDKLDTTSRSVYNAPDPQSYVNCVVGEPASKENAYSNYIKAVPDSLFNTATTSTAYADQIPTYPRVHNLYRYNRVINVGSGIDGSVLNDLNNRLNQELIELGSMKQVNLIVIVTGITDPSFRYAVENAWIGGKKNDATVFIGVDGNEIVWTDVMTFAGNKGNELYHVTLRDMLMSLKTFNSAAVAASIVTTTAAKYDRVTMEEFEYLKEQISPPTWVIVLAGIISVFGSILVSYIMTKVDIGGSNGYTPFRNRRKFR